MSVSDLYTYLCQNRADVVDGHNASQLVFTIEQWILEHGDASLLYKPEKKNVVKTEDDILDDLLGETCDMDGNCTGGNYTIKFGKMKGLTIPEVIKQQKGKSYLQWVVNQDWVYDDFVEECGKHGVKKKP